MQNRPHTYLFFIQYLGLRYAGWQRQKGVKTIQGALERGLRYVLGHEDFNILGASRTDSGVSCREGAFELFLKEALEIPDLVPRLNENLPSDIRIIRMQPIPSDFNIIQDVVSKSYSYSFLFGVKPDPIRYPVAAFFPGLPDVELMQKGAKLFVGEHDFKRFCSIDKVTDNYCREIFSADLCLEEPIPAEGEALRKVVFQVSGKGFLRYQVRIMAGALADLGLGILSFSDFEDAMQTPEGKPIAIAAPACGLVLEQVRFVL
ncbi:MAG: tRNA pseudouridine(38-40) synthase TruA [Mongoliibacter sp.]|uniref:tRNA pseudouridine synthase A n=1 Tax=Mongoliibacter sp. TaxID=2022438 RepID=UPI0012F0BFC9|nr:tRNA pseudouridine(38-40) synthase TruA [Mongoliibacter sp.]TVP47980.1 MAG: tRNA pseudouridine(38-40) synthase TruA [Mongoliibacter sp.]